MTLYLTGASNAATRAAAEGPLYGRLGLLLQPGTVNSYAAHVPSYAAWGFDNGCYSSGGAFDGTAFLRQLERIVETVDGAHESCRFAVAPDVFDPDAMRGDWRATIHRSAPWLPRIRNAGAPAALVAQDGLQHHLDAVPWDDLDVLFLGGSDAFKLGYASHTSAGCPAYSIDHQGATDPETRAWARMIYEAHRRGKAIHVGRVNSAARFRWCESIEAETADGTFLAYGCNRNLPQVTEWLKPRDCQLALSF